MITKEKLQEIRNNLRGPDFYHPEHFVISLLDEIEELLYKIERITALNNNISNDISAKYEIIKAVMELLKPIDQSNLGSAFYSRLTSAISARETLNSELNQKIVENVKLREKLNEIENCLKRT